MHAFGDLRSVRRCAYSYGVCDDIALREATDSVIIRCRGLRMFGCSLSLWIFASYNVFMKAVSATDQNLTTPCKRS